MVTGSSIIPTCRNLLFIHNSFEFISIKLDSNICLDKLIFDGNLQFHQLQKGSWCWSPAESGWQSCPLVILVLLLYSHTSEFTRTKYFTEITRGTEKKILFFFLNWVYEGLLVSAEQVSCVQFEIPARTARLFWAFSAWEVPGVTEPIIVVIPLLCATLNSALHGKRHEEERKGIKEKLLPVMRLGLCFAANRDLSSHFGTVLGCCQ